MKKAAQSRKRLSRRQREALEKRRATIQEKSFKAHIEWASGGDDHETFVRERLRKRYKRGCLQPLPKLHAPPVLDTEREIEISPGGFRKLVRLSKKNRLKMKAAKPPKVRRPKPVERRRITANTYARMVIANANQVMAAKFANAQVEAPGLALVDCLGRKPDPLRDLREAARLERLSHERAAALAAAAAAQAELENTIRVEAD
jgi:hypothetical protein